MDFSYFFGFFILYILLAFLMAQMVWGILEFFNYTGYDK